MFIPIDPGAMVSSSQSKDLRRSGGWLMKFQLIPIYKAIRSPCL